MKTKKLLLRMIILIFLQALFCTALNAQTTRVIHEPNSEIYKDIDRWHIQGYIREFLPIIRPYPVKLIDKILDEVMRNGDEAAQKKAASYQENLAHGSRIFHLGAAAFMQGKNDENGFLGGPFIEGHLRVTDFLSASFHFAPWGMTDAGGERFNVPGTYTPYPDFISDTSNIGSLEIRQNWTSLMAIGKNDMYFQAGLARTSVGPFFDNGLIAGPQTPRAGHFSFVFYRPQWSYEILFQSITAADDFGLGKFPDKYNIVHAISFRPIDSLELGAEQTIIFGGRIEPMYFVPFSFLFASQSLSGFDDNALIGIHLRWRPFDTFLINSQINIDDFHFNGLFEGVYKLKLAVEGGISWAPKESILSRLDFDYTAVFPYCYTHWNQSNTDRYTPDKPNYLNYTHLGRNIGPDLEPNSDRFSVRTSWNTIPGIDLSMAMYLIRHGNASEGLNDLDPKALHDGSIFDDGSEKQSASHIEHNPRLDLFLLTQDILDIRLGGGIGINWTIPSAVGTFSLMAEYGLQYGWNRGLHKGDNGLDHYWSIGGMWNW